jgi:hypothetical protein
MQHMLEQCDGTSHGAEHTRGPPLPTSTQRAGTPFAITQQSVPVSQLAPSGRHPEPPQVAIGPHAPE